MCIYVCMHACVCGSKVVLLVYRSVQGDKCLFFGICTSLVSPIPVLGGFVVFFTHAHVCKGLVSEP